MTPRQLRRAVRSLDSFLENYHTSGGGACAKDLDPKYNADPSPEYDPTIDGGILIARVHIDFKNRNVEIYTVPVKKSETK